MSLTDSVSNPFARSCPPVIIEGETPVVLRTVRKLSHLSLLNDFVESDREKRIARPAFGMCADSKEEAVQPHHYFYNPISGKPEEKRPRKFKDQTNETKKTPSIAALRTEREKLKEMLMNHAFSSNLSEKMIGVLIFHAEKDTSLESLPSSFNMKEAPQNVKIAYNKILELKPKEIPHDINEIINFETLSRRDILDAQGGKANSIKEFQKLLIDFYQNLPKGIPVTFNKRKIIIEINADHLLASQGKLNELLSFFISVITKEEDLKKIENAIDQLKIESEIYHKEIAADGHLIHLNNFVKEASELLLIKIKKCEEKLDEKNCQNGKEKLLTLFEKHWLNEALTITTKLPGKKTSTITTTIRDYFNQFGLKLVKVPGALFETLKELLKEEPSIDFILNVILNMLVKKLINNIEDYKNKKQILCSEFSETCRNTGTLFIEQAIHKMELGDNRVNCLQMLIKEQRQHSLARFNHLFNYLTAFVNTTAILGQIGETKHPGFKEQSKRVIAKLLEYAHIEMEDLPKERLEVLKNLITIDPQLHRSNKIMGCEENTLDTVKSQNVMNKLNFLLHSPNEKESVQGFERAHTLPFPTLFAWKIEKEIQFINEEMGVDLRDTTSDEIYFKHELFTELTTKNLKHNTIENYFRAELKKYIVDHTTKEDFLLISLELIRKFYIRLFSETEYLIGFMNTLADGASEWRLPKSDQTYKKSIGNCTKDLVEAGEIKEKSAIISALKPYLTESVNNLKKLNTQFVSSKEKMEFSPYDLLKCICFTQVEETMRIALNGYVDQETINEIFKKSLLVK